MATRNNRISFGLRIALYAVLLSVLALAGFASVAWWMIREAQLHALDNALTAQLQREILHPRNDQDWQHYEAILAGALGSAKTQDVLLAVNDKRADTNYSSANWPGNLSLDSFLLPAPAMPPPPPDAEVEPDKIEMPDIPMPDLPAPDSVPPLPDLSLPPPPSEADHQPPDFLPRPFMHDRRKDENFRLRQQKIQQEIQQRQQQREQDVQKIREIKQSLEEKQKSLSDREQALENARQSLQQTAEKIRAQTVEEGVQARRQALAGALAARISPVELSNFDANGHHYRIAVIERPGMRMAAGVNVDIIRQQMQPIRRAFVMAIALASLFVAVGAWWLSHRALQPLRRLTVAVRELGATQLDQRVDAAGDREIAELADSFNQMLERLERSFTQAARFSGDAAHELKTPLAILQAQVEHAIGDAEDGSPAQAHFAGMLDEIQHLGTVVRKLLLLSLADAGRLRLNASAIDLTAELEEMVEDARMLAPQLTITATIAEGLKMEADRDLLQQVLHNLLGNAIKYNIDNGWITIAARYKDRHVVISVLNATHGLTAESRKRLFERFYRGDSAHAARADSAGLGLSLSREIARAHGGDLVLESSDPGIAQFSLRLPRVQFKNTLHSR